MATKREDDSGSPIPETKPDPMALYNACLNSCDASPDGLSRLFTQNDLLQLYPPCNSSVKDLMPLIQHLFDRKYLRTLKAGGVLCWMLRPRDAALKLSALTREEGAVYELIEDAGTSGVWSKTIKAKSGLQQTAVTKAAGKLEGRGLIKQVKSVKGPGQRTYMLAHLVPGDDVTGGSFFDAGDLDESLIEELGNLIVFQVKHQSWAGAKIKRRVKKRPREEDEEGDGVGQGGDQEQHYPGAKEDKADAPAANGDDQYENITQHLQLAYQPGTHNYPTATSLHSFLLTSGAIREGKAATFSVEEVQSLLNILVWDGKLEKVGPAGYRTVRGVDYKVGESSVDMGGYDDSEVGNGVTEGPCSSCPVAELCTGDLEKGVVSAAACAYFGPWLEA
ncbi:RNA polymerase Rpc34 [Polychaeton citri CBS 116435]|uniref:DNA-directed RNA polymerase III subunit RPC6 n=1 Tax=Polychaeton citri CBS 116435 TaxID=1314669 RepID=A0A9P4QA34_9PEZI|nr:RNA polymerase Rpc34 [Polychaeton citri CBS 116435]